MSKRKKTKEEETLDSLGKIDLSKFVKSGVGIYPMKPFKTGELKAGGFTVEIFSKPKSLMHNAIGRFHKSRKGMEIWLDKRLSGQMREWVMLHELMHLLFYLTMGNIEEEDMRGFSTLLFGILKDNFNINLNRLKNGR